MPKTFNEITRHYHQYAQLFGCQEGERIASIGAGNGKFELTISCQVPGIEWYLEEIDSARLFEFFKVKDYFEQLKGSSIKGSFNLVLGTEQKTRLPRAYFDRILFINVFHELKDPEAILGDVYRVLKKDGKLVIMERMGTKPGQVHKDCKFPKLYPPDFLDQMKKFGFNLNEIQIGEKVSSLKFYTFRKAI